MAEIRIRDIDENVKLAIKANAKQAGLSMEAYIRNLLQKDGMRKKQRIAEDMHKARTGLFIKYGRLSDSAALIRDERDHRG